MEGELPENHGRFVAKLVTRRSTINEWPTDTIDIDFYKEETTDTAKKLKPNTILIFIPGNPGLIEWYSDTLIKIIRQLGASYAARGISYAGHGSGDDVVGSIEDHNQSFANKSVHQNTAALKSDNNCLRDMSVAWTIEGQIRHKLSWIDDVIKEYQPEELPRFVFLSHSFGAYIVQHLLIRRPDILQQTQQIIHLMPFVRFDPPPLQKVVLSSAAHRYKVTIPMLCAFVRLLTATMPRNLIDIYLSKVVGLDCDKGRKVALDVCTHSRMVKNHLVLGFEEIRALPELPNDVALRILGRMCPTSILFCGDPDQWAPVSHMEALIEMQRKSLINNINSTYIKELRHDFIVHPAMIEPVVEFCLDKIRHPNNLRSKL